VAEKVKITADAAIDVLVRVRGGDLLSSTPERWWDWLNPYVVRFEGEEPLQAEVCDYLKSHKLLKRSKRFPYLELAKRADAAITARGSEGTPQE
jgi:hypothetical protein